MTTISGTHKASLIKNDLILSLNYVRSLSGFCGLKHTLLLLLDRLLPGLGRRFWAIYMCDSPSLNPSKAGFICSISWDYLTGWIYVHYLIEKSFHCVSVWQRKLPIARSGILGLLPEASPDCRYLPSSPRRSKVHCIPTPNIMPTESETRSRRDSWPPTQVHMKSAVTKYQEPRPLLEIDDDDDPLTYFLTPTPIFEDEDECMGFDAGIEDPNQPHDIVRSVSPSTLDGLSKDRSMSPFSDSDMTSPDEDEEEDYIRFSPSSPTFQSFRDSVELRPANPIFNRSTNGLLSPPSSPKPRGRRGRPRSPRSRPAHLWRQPSPDVWSIEEETEEEMSEVAVEVKAGILKGGNDKGLDGKAAKPLKKVRFVLPGDEE